MPSPMLVTTTTPESKYGPRLPGRPLAGQRNCDSIRLRAMPHVIEPAASGRAKCRGCGEKIAKGKLRFGERLPNPFGDGDIHCGFTWPVAPTSARSRCSRPWKPPSITRPSAPRKRKHFVPRRKRASTTGACRVSTGYRVPPPGAPTAATAASPSTGTVGASGSSITKRATSTPQASSTLDAGVRTSKPKSSMPPT